MTLPIPSSPSAGNSPASEESNAPRTPLSPTLPLPAEQASNANTQSAAAAAANANNQGQPKRKPSRRANTAERRATHNAVERQRRETLNGRFLVYPFAVDPGDQTTDRSTGSCCIATEPFSDPSPVQVVHRKLVHRPHPCFPPPSSPGRPRASRHEG